MTISGLKSFNILLHSLNPFIRLKKVITVSLFNFFLGRPEISMPLNSKLYFFANSSSKESFFPT